MARVFLCHNNRDKPIVRRLSELLHKNGVETWVDEADIGSREWEAILRIEGWPGAIFFSCWGVDWASFRIK